MTAVRTPLETGTGSRRGRRRWPWITLALLVAGGALIANSPWLSVSEIDVRGAVHSDAEGRVADAGVGEGALLLWVNAGALQRAVEADPWVSDARVEKVWPDTILVEVLEHRPVAWVEGILGWMLVAEDGTVVERRATPEGGLLQAAIALPDVAVGERPVDPGWHEIVEMALVLDNDLGATMTLEMRGEEMWTTALGHDINLGHPIDLGDKARTLRALLFEEIPSGAIIDVTSPSRPVLVENPQDEVEGSDGES